MKNEYQKPELEVVSFSPEEALMTNGDDGIDLFNLSIPGIGGNTGTGILP